ncbi:MAG: outer membrane lipoprotein-sorting protein, partial [Gammaproteobacteria bacterium]|nr:outer membrane lipoprotein-sorting protein [Gammaproteobacteria bacterium]NIR95373.1 outer membrane lipoprotein-sorting protein [Gammaproteobacteria bacterium]NIX59586.1 outer membrane lipoprotein-sorting protein [candidate division Zixibacteria bacterium]
GLEIAKEMKARERGFINYTARMKMVLVSSSGDEKVRLLRVKTLEMDGDGDKTLAIFDSPADVKGTAFLSHSHVSRADDQWLFLPMLKRVKRIAPANQIAPFMGSEFSYEDLASAEVGKFTYDYLGDEVLDGRPCFKLERIPVSEYSGYSRQVVWVDKERYVPLRTDYYDRKGRL